MSCIKVGMFSFLILQSKYGNLHWRHNKLFAKIKFSYYVRTEGKREKNRIEKKPQPQTKDSQKNKSKMDVDGGR